MPRKSAGTAMVFNANGEQVKSISVELPIWAYKHLRVSAAIAEKSMGGLVRDMVLREFAAQQEQQTAPVQQDILDLIPEFAPE